MIRSKLAEVQTTMGDEEVALCQRVYDHVSTTRQIKSKEDREELARRIIHSYQHGVKDENALKRLLM
ncbi:hypothetical protein AMC90_PA00063 (plasmid) [Rhizobium phaseoli]|uniref:Uncharacterized protein n=1 Tax=Rhizobium phaseoli TaxID=396 RepID=A0ABM6CLE5_9HYPH|nr:hypothetical protein [Rhizobium phaseoli]ANL30173.1 hypothetical protein AMC90_PA00063 [Rhizobium phaseoli]ANL89167.1 hypothetical protein AMC81_PE00924 [Rhizobium phaseoli]ANL95676.1 hypothetical protein AMC80_PE00924 [Rhizobium phaseoli]PWI50946.1 hypothetical protein B5K03_26995 [Rhizobium phaseoli]